MSGENEERNAVQVLASTPQKRINEVHRFSLLTIAFFGSIVCSFGYAFNIISGEMQVRYDLSMTDLSTIIAVGSCIGYFMIPWSFLYDYFGPRPLTIPAFILFFTGQICMAFCFNGKIAGNTLRLTIFNVLASVGFTMYEFLNSLTIMGHFPVDKGAVIGLIKTFTGLGTAIVGTIQIAFFAGKTAEYFYFLSALGGGVGIPMVLFMKHPPYVLNGYQMKHLSPERKEELLATKAQYMKQRPPRSVFIYAFSILFFLIVYLPVQSSLVNYLSLEQTYKTVFAVVLIVAMAACTLVVPLTWLLARKDKDDDDEEEEERNRDTYEVISLNDVVDLPEQEDLTNSSDTQKADEKKKKEQEPVMNEDYLEPLDEEHQEEQQQQPGTETQKKKHVETEIDFIAPQYQTSFLRNLLTLRFWAFFWTVFVTVGPELSITYNATYMYAAVAEEPQSANTRVLLSVLNGSASAIGRLSMSFLENWSQKKPADKRIPITFTLFIPCVTVIIALVLFLTIPGSGLPAAFVLNSYGNGFLNACMVLISRTIFAKDPAKHHHIGFCACSLGALIFTRFVFAEWYAKEASLVGDGKVCMNKVCARVPNIIMLCCTCSGLLSASFLHVKYARFCRRVIAERNRLFQQEEETPSYRITGGSSNSNESVEESHLHLRQLQNESLVNEIDNGLFEQLAKSDETEEVKK